jgi:hypothetical protein
MRWLLVGVLSLSLLLVYAREADEPLYLDRNAVCEEAERDWAYHRMQLGLSVSDPFDCKGYLLLQKADRGEPEAHAELREWMCAEIARLDPWELQAPELEPEGQCDPTWEDGVKEALKWSTRGAK